MWGLFHGLGDPLYRNQDSITSSWVLMVLVEIYYVLFFGLDSLECAPEHTVMYPVMYNTTNSATQHPDQEFPLRDYVNANCGSEIRQNASVAVTTLAFLVSTYIFKVRSDQYAAVIRTRALTFNESRTTHGADHETTRGASRSLERICGRFLVFKVICISLYLVMATGLIAWQYLVSRADLAAGSNFRCGGDVNNPWQTGETKILFRCIFVHESMIDWSRILAYTVRGLFFCSMAHSIYTLARFRNRRKWEETADDDDQQGTIVIPGTAATLSQEGVPTSPLRRLLSKVNVFSRSTTSSQPFLQPLLEISSVPQVAAAAESGHMAVFSNAFARLSEAMDDGDVCVRAVVMAFQAGLSDATTGSVSTTSAMTLQRLSSIVIFLRGDGADGTHEAVRADDKVILDSLLTAYTLGAEQGKACVDAFRPPKRAAAAASLHP